LLTSKVRIQSTNVFIVTFKVLTKWLYMLCRSFNS